MASKTVLFGLLVVLLVNYSLAKDLTVCPNSDKATKAVYDKEVATSVVGSTIRVRVPDSLFLKKPITCIVILDNNHSDSVPELEDGGVDSTWVTINISPAITELLSYRIQVYTNE
ncbi:uncharacterized protein [Diabrotica undecimpunctata]|uniref:uncharacterized protein n=1 Tax=Diabrotica undecimpunctata TaxID=50387 RepID=UPI003B641765